MWTRFSDACPCFSITSKMFFGHRYAWIGSYPPIKSNIRFWMDNSASNPCQGQCGTLKVSLSGKWPLKFKYQLEVGPYKLKEQPIWNLIEKQNLKVLAADRNNCTFTAKLYLIVAKIWNPCAKPLPKFSSTVPYCAVKMELQCDPLTWPVLEVYP